MVRASLERPRTVAFAPREPALQHREGTPSSPSVKAPERESCPGLQPTHCGAWARRPETQPDRVTGGAPAVCSPSGRRGFNLDHDAIYECQRERLAMPTCREDAITDDDQG